MSSVLVKFDSKHVQFRCPECMESLALGPDHTPDYVPCPHCAAIAYFDMKNRIYRMPKTDEWLAVVTQAGFWELLDARERIVAKLTEPYPQPAPKPHVEQPRATPVRRR